MPPHCSIFPPLPLLPAPNSPVPFTLPSWLLIVLPYLQAIFARRTSGHFSSFPYCQYSPCLRSISHFTLIITQRYVNSGCQGSNPGQSMWDLRWTEQQCGENPHEYLRLRLSVSFHNMRMHYVTRHRHCVTLTTNSVVKRAQGRCVNTTGHRQRSDNELYSEHQQQMQRHISLR